MSFWKDKKTLVTGGHGFVGHAVLKQLKKMDCKQIIAPKKNECDLTIESNVKKLFSRTKPEIVIHLAGKVGGIGANKSAKGEFFYKNIMMGTLLFEHSRLNGVEKLVALAAGCGYPKHLQNALKENDFWNGLPDENSIGYSMAKKMLIIQSWTYREQYGFNSSVLLPANLYGPHDNYNLETSHVIPALVRKFVEAEENNSKEVAVWGSGLPSREFLYVEDTAKAILAVAKNYNESGPLNLGTGIETSIKKLAETIKRLTGFKGQIIWDESKPDGQMRKYYDMSLFKEKLGYIPNTSLEDGLKKTIKWYRLNPEYLNDGDELTQK
jgi:GDP-L-fucose synthase